MFKTTLITALAAVALPLGGLAYASETENALVGTEAGTTPEAIEATLTDKGFEVRKIESEDGMLEAYAMKDGERFEIYVDRASGKVVKVEED